MLTLIATICEEKYFNRNLKVQSYIESQFEELTGSSTIDNTLLGTLKFIDKLRLDDNSYWFNKANIFTLIIELYKYDVKSIDIKKFKSELEKIEEDNVKYLQASRERVIPKVSNTNLKYIEFSREGVNGKPAREYRGKVISKIIKSCLN
jgi:hypothetical protein